MSFALESIGHIVTDIRSGFASGGNDPNGVVQFRMNNVGRGGEIIWDKLRRVPRTKVRKDLLVLEGDILFNATNSPELVGKTAFFEGFSEPVTFSNHFIRIRVSREVAHAPYVARCLQREFERGQFQAMCRSWVNQASITKDQLCSLSIPLPPLDEQRRIATILDKADALRRKRKRAIELLDSLTLSIFLDTFGDPVSNPKDIPSNELGNVASFVSGGTPTKSIEDYWNGKIPWVSPKDMKVQEVFDAEDHVSDKALCETSLKRIEANSVLLVVRGMILAHTVPIAITRTPTTINQDMKAIQFHSNVNPEFGLWCLLAQHDHILTKVSSAAHGTKRLDMVDVLRFPILMPSNHQQALFISAASKVTHNRMYAVRQSQAADVLFSSLQHRAFSGQL